MVMPASVLGIHGLSVRTNIGHRVFQSLSEIMINCPHFVYREHTVRHLDTKRTELSELWAGRSTKGKLQSEHGIGSLMRQQEPCRTELKPTRLFFAVSVKYICCRVLAA